MHRLGSATVATGFTWGKHPKFPWEKSQWDDRVVKTNKTKKTVLHQRSPMSLSHKNTSYRFFFIAGTGTKVTLPDFQFLVCLNAVVKMPLNKDMV